MNHSQLLYRFSCRNDPDEVRRMFDYYDDIDLFYREGAIIKSIITDNDVETLKAALDYFENKQFPNKDERYEEANRELIEIMEEAIDGDGPSPGIRAIIAEYQGIDVAQLADVFDESDEEDADEAALESHDYVGKYGVTSAALLKTSNIEDCVFAAQRGDVETIRNTLDMTNRSYKLLIISTAVQNEQDVVVDTLAAMAGTKHKQATIFRMAGDVCTKNSLFQQAEAYYNKSLAVHPNYYVTYSKLGALYQRWSFDDSIEQEEQAATLRHKAIENYSVAFERKPVHIKYKEVQDKLDLLSRQLQFLQMDEHTEASDNESYEATEELLSISSEDEDEIEEIGIAGASAADAI